MALNIKIPEGTLTKYEKARILGARATQIANGAPILIKLTKKEMEKARFNPLEIARMEFEKGVIPIEVRRILPYEKTG